MPEATHSSTRLLDSLNVGSAEEMADLLRLILSQDGEGILVINSAREVIYKREVASQMLCTTELPPPDKEWSSFYGFYLPDMVTPYPPGQTPLQLALRGRSFNDAHLDPKS